MNLVFGTVAILCVTFCFWRFFFFFRDPKRIITENDNSITAPADGFITYVKQVRNGQIPTAVKKKKLIPLVEFNRIDEIASDGYLIGTFMTAFSVHRNRIPVSGVICYKEHRPAAKNITMARLVTYLIVNRQPFEEKSDFLFENERITIGIKTSSGEIVTVTQIADQWINRIIARVNIGDSVKRGDEYGFIRFGSQVDIFVPQALADSICVKSREYVKAGETIIIKTPETRRNKSYKIRFANQNDNKAIISLISSNPIVMESVYKMDRSPDFFRLHKNFPGSKVLIAIEKDEIIPAAIVSCFLFKGRIYKKNIPYYYFTDFNRNPNRKNLGAALDLTNHGLIRFKKSTIDVGFCLVNDNNKRAKKFMDSSILPVPFEKVGLLKYYEIIPLKNHRIPQKYNFTIPRTDKELQLIIDFINQFYINHNLYNPLTLKEIKKMYRRYTGFNEENIIALWERGKLLGAMIFYDPSQFINIKILKFDKFTKIFSILLRKIYRHTGLFFSPPREGEYVRTIQIRYYAWEGRAGNILFRYLNNYACSNKYHTISCMLDENERLPISNRFKFSYKSILYGTFKGSLRLGIEKFKTSPIFFDGTVS